MSTRWGPEQLCSEMVSEVTSYIVVGINCPSVTALIYLYGEVVLVPALVAGGGGMEGSWGQMFKVQENQGESSSQHPSQTSSPLFLFIFFIF